MLVLLEGSPISTEELWSSVSDHWVLVHLPVQGPSPPIAQFGRAAISSGSKCLPIKNDGDQEQTVTTVYLGDLQCCRHFFRSVPRHNPVSELYGQFLPPHGLVYALTYTVNCGTLYGQVCAFLNRVQIN